VAGWAEYCLGAGKGTNTFVYCNIGSGIGGALVVDGKLYNGQGLGACEIGHTWVADWTSSTPGAIDKLEHLCSGWSITRRIRRWNDLDKSSILGRMCGGDATQLTCPMLADAARAGDPRASKEIEDVAAGVGQALANVVTLLHPERIAMGGGVSLMGAVLLDALADRVEALAFGAYQGSFEVVPCALEEDVVTAGALLMASALAG
jgi:glucokinase